MRVSQLPKPRETLIWVWSAAGCAGCGAAWASSTATAGACGFLLVVFFHRPPRCFSDNPNQRARLPDADDQVGGRLGVHRHRVDPDVGRLGRLVGRIDAGEIGELAGARLAVEALGVAPLGLGERGVDEDLDEVAVGRPSRGPSRRSARNGLMKAVSTIRPASIISFAASPARRIFSTRSAAVKPRSLLSPSRTLSPSSRKVWRPRACELAPRRDWRWSICRRRERPVNQSSFGALLLQRGAALGGDVERLLVDILRAAQARSGSARRRRWRR